MPQNRQAPDYRPSFWKKICLVLADCVENVEKVNSHCIVIPGAFNELKYSETELTGAGKTKENRAKKRTHGFKNQWFMSEQGGLNGPDGFTASWLTDIENKTQK